MNKIERQEQQLMQHIRQKRWNECLQLADSCVKKAGRNVCFSWQNRPTAPYWQIRPVGTTDARSKDWPRYTIGIIWYDLRAGLSAPCPMTNKSAFRRLGIRWNSCWKRGGSRSSCTAMRRYYTETPKMDKDKAILPLSAGKRSKPIGCMTKRYPCWKMGPSR